MSTTGQLCGLEQKVGDNDNLCEMPICKECENGNNASSHGNAMEKVDSLSPMTDPKLSLSSYASCVPNYGESRVSNYDDRQAHMIKQTRDYGDVGLDTGQSHSSLKSIENAVVLGNGSSLKDTKEVYSEANNCITGSALPVSVEKDYRCNSLAFEDCKGNESGRTEMNNSVLEEDQQIRVRDDADGVANAVSKSSFLPNGKMDPSIWIPPDAEDGELDVDSVAYNDDDDDYTDGATWGRPSSLSSLDEQLGNPRSYKEERQKAMMEAMNGQFKILVSRLLASEGMSLSEGKGSENWLDIVASLSWEAALLIKPDANEGRAMDPGSYVKVKCISSGARSESQVIKGLAFKKNTAHKHMPTKFKNPRLLLLQGSLGHSAVGLSSFESMGQEDDYKKSFVEMIESCNPNVVLVEKSVSRDIQGYLLDKGITLVFDIKFPRLERIARCTGSQIISSGNMLLRPKLKQCDSFHVEKFIEEHIPATEGGKKPTKTLMFLEGCPKPLGCTILLKGAHRDELKKVKHVLQYTIFAAYHLILETSFFADQRTFFYDTSAVKELNKSATNESVASESGATPIAYNVDGSAISIYPPNALDIPIADGSVEESAHEQLYNKANSEEIILSDSSVQTLASRQLLSSVSASVRKFMGDKITPLTTDVISSYFGFNDKIGHSTSPLASPHQEIFDHEKEEDAKIKKEDLDDEFSNNEKVGVEPDRNETIEQCSEKFATEVQTDGNGDIESALDPQSILILLSTYCIPKQTVCEQSHLSRIKYYGNFDMSLGRYLQDILLGQKYSCTSCGEPPEAHVYRYTHQNGNLTVLVRRLPRELTLSGEAEGKIWMWTRCLKCEHECGTPRPTRRVVMSSAARGLSFGKFLELSFSSHSAAGRLSICGHLLHRDCLRFFGLGSKVAMFKYSSVEIYAAWKPPPMLEFCNPHEQEWFLREARDVLYRGDLFFMEVAGLLKKLKPKCTGVLLKRSLNVSDSVLEFDEVEEMLMRDKTEFEASLLKETSPHVRVAKNEHEILSLNWLRQELIFLLYVWDCRLHSICLCMKDGKNSKDTADDQVHKSNDEISCNEYLEGNALGDNHEVLEASSQIPIKVDEFAFNGSHEAENHTRLETNLVTEVSEVSEIGCLNSSEKMTMDMSNKSCSEDCIPIVEDHTQEDSSIPILIGPLEPVESTADLGAHESQKPEDFELEDPKRWIWAPFSELRKILRNDLQGGFLLRFEFINTYSPTQLSPIQKLATQISDSLHFQIGPSGSVISVIEDEISSIIACALALYEERAGKGENSNAIDKSLSFTSRGSTEFERIKSSRSFSSLTPDELATLGSDGSLFSNRMMPSENLHPEITVGSSKFAGKSKYSVVCVYAEQFNSLRKRCCSSEMAYISSLSRCKKWDAQGGKSKVLFAKTMDDRFIIKQIKKPELESFLKFGPDYFRHVTLSVDSGSQTCLAKILGIYQVRQYKSGKEIKIDVVVMENLFFGRNISRKYDLKGAVFSRYISNSNDTESVLLDENFVEDMRISPIYIGGKNKHLLQRAIWNDTSFLTSINVMDYSLLVGVDQKRHEIVFGIIDYLRQYTWDKQLETWVKAYLVIPKNELPTVISPKEYKKRFRKFMTKYFLTVPDNWSSQQCSGSCKACDVGSNNVTGLHQAKLSDE